MNKPVSAKCCSRISNELEQISPKMSRSRKLSCKKGGVDCEVSRRERDLPNAFVPTPYLPPHVFRDIDTKPESLPHFILPLTDQKRRGPFRIEYFPTFRGEIESVNMTYVIVAGSNRK